MKACLPILASSFSAWRSWQRLAKYNYHKTVHKYVLCDFVGGLWLFDCITNDIRKLSLLRMVQVSTKQDRQQDGCLKTGQIVIRFVHFR